MTHFHSREYMHYLECEPLRFDNDELVRRYQAGEFLYADERRDAEIVIAGRARRAAIMAKFDGVIDQIRRG